MRMSKFSGYTEALAKECLGKKGIRALVGSGLSQQPEYVDGKPTGKIASTRLEFYLEGVGSDNVKLPSYYELDPSIKDWSLIELVNPEAIQVNNNVYFKAEGVKLAK